MSGPYLLYPYSCCKLAKPLVTNCGTRTTFLEFCSFGTGTTFSKFCTCNCGPRRLSRSICSSGLLNDPCKRHELKPLAKMAAVHVCLCIDMYMYKYIYIYIHIYIYMCVCETCARTPTKFFWNCFVVGPTSQVGSRLRHLAASNPGIHAIGSWPQAPRLKHLTTSNPEIHAIGSWDQAPRLRHLTTSNREIQGSYL